MTADLCLSTCLACGCGAIDRLMNGLSELTRHLQLVVLQGLAEAGGRQLECALFQLPNLVADFRQGLNVELLRRSGCANIREKLIASVIL